MTSRVLVSSSSSSSAAAAAAFLPRIPNPCANPSHRGAPPCGAALWRHHSGRAVTTAAAAAATGDHWGAEYHGGGGGRGGKSAAGPGVQCDVDVVSWRERRVFASVAVAADVDTVWRVITDYERLAEFIPNLVHSGRIPCPHQGRVWLEQRGLQQALYWHIEARVVLDLKEVPDAVNGRELHFSMVDGDFKKFEGKWSIRSGPRSSSAILLYEVNVIPRFNFPAIFLERIIRSDLPVNLGALACRAENIYLGNQRHGTAKFSGAGSRFHNFRNATTENDAIAPSKFTETPPSGLGGVLASPPSELNSKWGVYGNVCRLDRPCVVDEIHLRRFDGLLEHEGAHRFVFASITVKAPVREVWNILTAYEKLPDSDILLYKYELTKLSVRFVPNLAISRIIRRDNNKVRILQEGCKGLLYMVLHARVVMDLREKLEREISFEQVEGDFYSFKGKWRLEQLGDQHTLLKYMVETKMHKDTFLSESILEEIFHQTYVQSVIILKRQKLRADGFMPKRKHLRLHGRVDIEKAITRMGGFRKIASIMNLSLSYKNRKPRGYWDNLENLQEEIRRFQKNWGMDPAYMPSRKSFERAGRYDIARALEKWGGVHEVSRLLSLELRRPRRRANSDDESKAGSSYAITNKHASKPNKPSVSPDKQKWLLKLKDLDANWIEY
uniref:Coenzyme Q-binding protein COQ10 START domain-containing protein n=1 Tax=Oryza glumipatula TaxID=40148 RepID=A0A0D9ZFI4_9ORYZ